MPLLCAGTPLLRKSSGLPDHDVCTRFVDAVDAAYTALQSDAAGSNAGATRTPQLADVPCVTVKGDDATLLVVLQRELGAVVPEASTDIQSRVCSIDATTCLIVGLRDPLSGVTCVAHLDHGGDQVDDALTSLMEYIPDRQTQSDAQLSEDTERITALCAQRHARRYVNLYLLGAVRFPKFSASTLASLLRACADDQDTLFDVVPHGVCVWSQNRRDGQQIIHRGLMIDARTGAAVPVECDKLRAYPGGRLRALRSFDDRLTCSPITPKYGEKVVLGNAQRDRDAPQRRLLPLFIVIRPFPFPAFGPSAIQKPLSVYKAMSTTPEMEPDDFAETLKSAVVFAAVTKNEDVFKPAPPGSASRAASLPVVFQLCVTALDSAESLSAHAVRLVWTQVQ